MASFVLAATELLPVGTEISAYKSHQVDGDRPTAAPTNTTDGNGMFIFKEQTTDPGGGANQARLFAKDNGSGKTQLCAVFSSGGVQVLATEP